MVDSREGVRLGKAILGEMVIDDIAYTMYVSPVFDCLCCIVDVELCIVDANFDKRGRDLSDLVTKRDLIIGEEE